MAEKNELRLSSEKLVYGGDGWRMPMEIPCSCRTCYLGRVARGGQIKEKEIDLGRICGSHIGGEGSHEGKGARTFKSCGGCHYQAHFAGGAGSAEEGHFARDAFAAGGIAWDGPLSSTRRNRTDTESRTVAVRSGMPRAIGYFLPESSVIIPIDECPCFPRG